VPVHSSPPAVTVTALEVETRAVLRQLGKYTVETVNGTGFFRGRFDGWNVAVVEAGPGNAGAWPRSPFAPSSTTTPTSRSSSAWRAASRT
jgi:hypothetical protein